MAKYGKYILLLCLIVQSTFIFSARTKDTIPIQKETENYQIISNIDSLLNLWYVKNTLKSQFGNFQIASYNDTVDYPDSVYVERILNMKSPMDFSYNPVVKNFIDLYAKRRKNLVGIMLGLSEYYFPIFEKMLDANDMPLELKYLPVIESALNPRAVSRAGATGIWQFMYTTGKLQNLKINSFIDERRDPVKATSAAVKYLKQLYSIYGDWMLAIAAYNCGPGNVNKAIKRSSGKMNYWEVYNYLPKETRGYIPAFIAANYIMTYYKEHNIVPQKIERFATDTMMVANNLHLEQVSVVLGIDINLLRDLNPQYKRDIIPARGELFALTLPVEYVNKYIDLKDSVFRYKDSIYFNPKKIYYGPSDQKAADYALLAKVFYTVKPGDNLKLIAKWFNVDPVDIRQWNKIKKKKNIKNGQNLTVYVPKDKVDEYKKLNNMTFEAKQLFAASNNNSSGKLTAFQNKKINDETEETIDAKEKEINDLELEKLRKVLESIDSPRADDSINIAATLLTDSLNTVNENTESTTNNTVEVKTEELDHDFLYYTVKSGDTLWSIAKSFSELTYDLMKLNNLSDGDVLSPGQKLKIKKKK